MMIDWPMETKNYREEALRAIEYVRENHVDNQDVAKRFGPKRVLFHPSIDIDFEIEGVSLENSNRIYTPERLFAGE